MTDTQAHEILSLTTTVASQADAQHLAQGLLEARLAACVQVDAVLVSHYRWQGAAHADAEWRLTVKTLPDCLEPVLAHLAEHHPYEVPQLLWQVLQASEGYARWVRGEVSAPAGAGRHPPG